MIVQAILTGYRVKEFIQFVGNALIIVDQHNPDTLKISDQYQALNTIYQQLLQVYKQDTVGDTATQLAKLDARRDQAIICLRMLSEGYVRHHDEKRQVAGEQLLACIDKYGTRIYHLNYSAETAALKNLVCDLETVLACQEALNLLHLTSTVEEIKQANQAFEQLFVRQLRESSQKKPLRTRELIRQVAEAYRTLIKFVEAHVTLSPSAPYTLFIGHLNENTKHFNQLVEQRRSHPEVAKSTAKKTPETTSV